MINYVAGENLSNNSENSKRKEKSINRFRSIEDSYNEQSGIKTKTRKRNRTINNNDEPNERNTKFIKVVETIVGEKTDESVVDINIRKTNSIYYTHNSRIFNILNSVCLLFVYYLIIIC